MKSFPFHMNINLFTCLYRHFTYRSYWFQTKSCMSVIVFLPFPNTRNWIEAIIVNIIKHSNTLKAVPVLLAYHADLIKATDLTTSYIHGSQCNHPGCLSQIIKLSSEDNLIIESILMYLLYYLYITLFQVMQALRK